MPDPTTSIGFSPSTPAPAAGFQNAVPQSDGGTPLQRVSMEVPNTGGATVKTADYTAVAGDCGTLLVFNSASALTLTLPASIPFAQWKIEVQNIGAGTLTVSPNGLDLDGSSSSLSLAQNTGIGISTDGTNYFSVRGAGAGAGGITQLTGDVTAGPGSGSQVATLEASGVTAGSYTSADITVDAKGRVTAASDGSSGSATYFGQGYATASAAQDQITLGSTPLAGSVSVFVDGLIVSPSAYSITGSVILLSSLSSGNEVVVDWATADSSPGGITLGTYGASLRGTGIVTSTSASVTISFPSGTQAGDLAVLFATGCYAPNSAPSGWSTIGAISGQPNWNGGVFSKVLTSGDITTGSVTVSLAEAQDAVVAIATFIGGTGGIRETDLTYAYASPATVDTSTSGAVLGSDFALLFGSYRSANASPTVNVGTEQQAANDGSLAAGCLYAGVVPGAGSFTATFSYSSFAPGGYYQAIVIVTT